MTKGDKDDPIYIRASVGDPDSSREFDRGTWIALGTIFVIVCLCAIREWFR